MSSLTIYFTHILDIIFRCRDCSGSFKSLFSLRLCGLNLTIESSRCVLEYGLFAKEACLLSFPLLLELFKMSVYSLEVGLQGFTCPSRWGGRFSWKVIVRYIYGTASVRNPSAPHYP